MEDPRWLQWVWRVLRRVDIHVDFITTEEAAQELLGREVRFIWRPVIHTGEEE
jgi:hypothetical protein